MEIPSRFPPNVLSPGTPYVYFMSLAGSTIGDYIISQVSPYFAGSLSANLIKGKSGTQNIDDAFDFLDTVIAAEYSKEKNFLEYLKTKTKGIKNFTIPTSSENWNSFVKDIQQALGGGENALQAMENELLRLEKQNARRGEKKNISGTYEQDQISKLTNYADMLNKYINNRTKENNSKLSSQIYGLILSKFGSKLISIGPNGELIFNRSQLLGLTNSISSIIMHDYIIKNSLDSNKIYKQFGDQIDIKELEKIADNEVISERINALIDNSTALPFLTDDMAENLGLLKTESDETFDKDKINALASSITDINNCATSLESIGNLFHDLYANYTIPESAFKITSTGNIYSEVVSSINALMHGATGAFNTGSAGAKPDNIIGFVTISIDELLALKGRDQQLYDAAVNELKEIHLELKRLSNGLKSTNTAKYYQTQEQDWNLTVKRIKSSLKRLRENYNLLGNCYIIEDSTKNYISLYAKTINNKLADSLHGGSLGPNISDQINKITTLAHLGGISFPDAKWLISVIINSGPGMIASGQKNSLESYLAAFATILLFDDQINIVKEAYKKISKQFPSGSVEKIHLFSVNDGYYPLSYVLQETRQALSINYDAAQAIVNNDPSGGARVEISGYVSAPAEAYKNNKAANQWSATSKAALASTKIHITFLAGFLGVLQKLFPDIK